MSYIHILHSAFIPESEKDIVSWNTIMDKGTDGEGIKRLESSVHKKG